MSHRHSIAFVFATALICQSFGSGDRVLGQDATLDAPSSSDVVEDQFIYKSVTDDSSGKSTELFVDWTRPADWSAEDSRPAAVFFHGGGWTGGKPGQFALHSKELAGHGMVCFRVKYRLLGKKSKTPPDNCVEDASDAFRYIRANASKFGIDPKRMASGGGSAGGHLAAYLGTMDDQVVDGASRKPAAMLLFNPVYDNGPGGWGTARVGDEFAKYSPAHNITKDDPPSIVFLGTKDNLIPVATAERFRDDCKEVGVRSELHLYEGQPHGFFNAKKTDGGGKIYRDTMEKTVAFLKSLNWIE
ncbi:alpha/beta hydrolase [Rhodopirellula baltica]|uniref:Lipase/esterase n=1 Tax=Rhodopirellula baltica SWK14 TaxID=993516 RepID=L7C6G5_RHOBT|nr:alpha/beta hydrolase [Rhodopirellula baltica]ELP29779.1 lipase/esterase [Rhodopirellula baltica SWK14]